jgi:manganese/zinc/iron transport system permease protein
MNFLHFFTDPILRAPTLGSMLMCLAAALVGVLVFVRKRSLLGEALSHATYPGVTSAIIFAGFFNLEASLPFLVLFGAFLSSLIGFWVIEHLEKKLKVAPDAALGAVLALFFGIGVTIASFAQNAYTHLYRQMQTFLYGQAATMTDVHLYIYGSLAAIVFLFIICFYREVLAFSFDAQFAQATGIAHRFVEVGIFLLIVLSIVTGVRCVGVVLMSAMLIAPAAAARQFTHKLSTLFILAGVFGVVSAFLGIYSSVIFSQRFKEQYALPTGPTIVLVSGGIALYALLFAPNRGLIRRYIRIVKFRGACVQENLLKALWRLDQENKKELTIKELAYRVGFTPFYLRLFLYRLIWQKKLIKMGKYFQLTPLGLKKGGHIVRLHRLWEVYLVNSLGLNVERVHKSAEEMEHILTPELEKKLAELLDHPVHDPHDQPIPNSEGIMPNVL